MNHCFKCFWCQTNSIHFRNKFYFETIFLFNGKSKQKSIQNWKKRKQIFFFHYIVWFEINKRARKKMFLKIYFTWWLKKKQKIFFIKKNIRKIMFSFPGYEYELLYLKNSFSFSNEFEFTRKVKMKWCAVPMV